MAKDQSLNVELPPARSLPRKVARVLAPAYEKIGRGEWRDGFKSASQVLEVEAKAHLKAAASRRSVSFINLDTGNPLSYPPSKIDRLPAGALATAYAQIATPNLAQSIVAKALRQINDDRVAITHRERSAATENRLRKNVGRHMFMIMNALKALS
jgi:hypothetical protein